MWQDIVWKEVSKIRDGVESGRNCSRVFSCWNKGGGLEFNMSYVPVNMSLWLKVGRIFSAIMVKIALGKASRYWSLYLSTTFQKMLQNCYILAWQLICSGVQIVFCFQSMSRRVTFTAILYFSWKSDRLIFVPALKSSNVFRLIDNLSKEHKTCCHLQHTWMQVVLKPSSVTSFIYKTF